MGCFKLWVRNDLEFNTEVFMVSNEIYDVLIIGGGVIGSAAARELSRYHLKTGVVEKAADVCTQTSGRNTGMLHAGFLYKTGSLKAECCVEGNREFDRVAEELDVPFKRTGKLIVGFTEEEKERLKNFIRRGEDNGVTGMRLIDRQEMDRIDSSAGGNFAIWCPASGILDPFQYTVALAENAVNNGVRYHLNTEVTGIEELEDHTHVLHTTAGDMKTRWVVNCAGLGSADISAMLGIPGYVLNLVKGEYFVLDKRAGEYAKIPVYPAPTPQNTFDTHATPTIDGNVLVGPDSKNAEAADDYDATQDGMDGLAESGRRMFSEMKREYYIRNFAGIRPKRIDPETGEIQDFLIEMRPEHPQVVNLVGIESPGLTSALPIARRIVKMIASSEELRINPDFNPVRKGIRRFAGKDPRDQVEMIRENSDYGEIVCRCETVTKAEILQAIHNPLGVHTISGIKDRTRATMGRCQGGYCEMRIAELICSELGEKPEDVRLSSQSGWMFNGNVRQGEAV